jgi:hypothetical protein
MVPGPVMEVLVGEIRICRCWLLVESFWFAGDENGRLLCWRRPSELGSRRLMKERGYRTPAGLGFLRSYLAIRTLSARPILERNQMP